MLAPVMLRLSRTSLALALLLPCLAAGPTVLAAAAEDPAWQRPARAQAARDAAFSIRYYLRRYGEAPVLAERLDRLEVPDPGGNPTLRSLVESALRLYRREASAAEQPALAEAARRTLLYFGAADTPLFAPAAPELLPMSPDSAAPGWPPGTADARDLPMDDPRGYALLRLGAFGELLTKLPTGLRLHTAAGTEGAWPEGCRPRRAWRLAFPGTVHGFQALAGECSDGGFALALWGFSSPSLFLHQAALQRAALAGAPEARVTHDPSARARTRDDLLLAPFGEGSPLPRRFDVLALGYFDELRDEFAGAALTESSGDGWRGFSARVGSASLVALEIDESWYGECLGASVARLLETGVAFSTLAFAGSAGALDYFPPYSLVFPTCFLSRTGERLDLPNAFAGDGTQDCHLAVESPLVETRDLLRAFAGRAATVDVESFALARAVRERRLALGAAYLVTDYPDARPPMKAYGLSQVRFTQRLEGPRAYARLLRSHLLSGARGFRHPLETALQRPIGPLSAAAARRAREALGPLSAAEQALAARIEAETPRSSGGPGPDGWIGCSATASPWRRPRSTGSKAGTRSGAPSRPIPKTPCTARGTTSSPGRVRTTMRRFTGRSASSSPAPPGAAPSRPGAPGRTSWPAAGAPAPASLPTPSWSRPGAAFWPKQSRRRTIPRGWPRSRWKATAPWHGRETPGRSNRL